MTRSVVLLVAGALGFAPKPPSAPRVTVAFENVGSTEISGQVTWRF